MSPGKKGFSERSSSVLLAIETSARHYGILTMLLEVILAGSHELNSSELVAINI
jgi:hypothetical protein